MLQGSTRGEPDQQHQGGQRQQDAHDLAALNFSSKTTSPMAVSIRMRETE
jgi:hypothetical protein